MDLAPADKLPRVCAVRDVDGTLVYAEGLQTLLLVVLHGFRDSLLLLISEIGFCQGNDVLQVEFSSRHVELDLESVPLGVPKDVLVQK